MKKIIRLLLGCIMILNWTFPTVISATPDYSCYEGLWSANPNVSIYEDHRCIDIIRADNLSMDFTFHWYQFEVQIRDAKIDGTTVHGQYYEVWDDGGIDWDNYVVQGNVTLILGEKDITINWIGIENGSPFSKEFKVYNPNFKYMENSATTIILNGSKLSFDQPPIIKNDRTLVPLRTIFEAMGYSVNWNQDKQTAIATLVNNKITVQLNNKTINYTVNGKSDTYICDVEPQIVSDRILVPVRAIAESAGCEVSWDDNSKTVYINSDVIYETKTVTINASTLDEWNEKVESIERGLIGVSNLTKLDANGNEIFNGKIIIDREVLSYNKIEVEVPKIMGPYTGKKGEYDTIHINIPLEIKYVLHKHKTENKATVSAIGRFMTGLVEQDLVLIQTCNCGYENVVKWSIPDFSSISKDKQSNEPIKNEYTIESTTSLYVN